MPSIYVIAGANGAGKLTTAPALLRDELAIPTYVNADTIAAGLSAFDPDAAAFQAGRIMLTQLNHLRDARGRNLPTTANDVLYEQLEEQYGTAQL